ncbi:MAG: acyl-CoA dehydrogenase family protein [Hyphomonadaceae bacterium]|nr:acyl-CoA dehydrogenase family protein [Hyphomonadaceae bacterium]
MKLTTEHEAIRRTMRRFIEDEINPHVEAWEEDEIFPAHEVFKKLGDLGMLGLSKPAEYGGAALDFSYSLVMLESLGYATCLGIPMAVAVQSSMATPALAQYGSPELCREFLTPAIAGDVVSCIGVSEPGAGSDVAAIKTFARSDGDDYVINGTKTWITNSTQADWMCCLVNTEGDDIHRNKTLVIVPMRAKGVSVVKKIRKLGMNASDTAQIFFDDVRVPKRNRIGEEGRGFVYQMEQFQEERLAGSVYHLPAFERALDETIAYARERQIFGKSLLENQMVHFTLAELKAEVELLRGAIYQATERIVDGEDATFLASIIKLKTGRLARELPDKCMQFWGGVGYTREVFISRLYRDARLLSIAGGADEVMLQIIAKKMGILPRRR